MQKTLLWIIQEIDEFDTHRTILCCPMAGGRQNKTTNEQNNVILNGGLDLRGTCKNFLKKSSELRRDGVKKLQKNKKHRGWILK